MDGERVDAGVHEELEANDCDSARLRQAPGGSGARLAVAMVIWDYWPGHEGGAQRQCRKLSHALAQRGIRVVILTQRTRWLRRPPVADHGTRIVRLGMLAPLASCALRLSRCKARWRRRSGGDLRRQDHARRGGATAPLWWLARFSFMRAARRYIRRHGRVLDLLHAHESNWISGFASWLGSRASLPVVCKAATIPCLPSIGAGVPTRARLEHWRLRPHFIALNDEMAGDLEDAGVDASRIHRIANGVEIPPGPAPAGSNVQVLLVANFTQSHQAKAYDVLLQAWSRVAAAEPQARLEMIGRGDHRAWRDLARQLGCADSISFPGFSGMEEHYRRAAMLVLPSRREGMSNALLEAQSWGVPAVVSAIPGNLAVVRHEHNGLVFPLDDSEALARSILRLLREPLLRAELGRRARERMAADFSIDAIGDQTINLYRRLKGTPPPGARRPSAGEKSGGILSPDR
ncbi:MAG: glycosyltransferase family 4 protein [Candidatus Aminicenantes bacterium]|nr:glycosyltransferase family 4 protein [Candidatus Aminicenantes bacterium]